MRFFVPVCVLVCSCLALVAGCQKNQLQGGSKSEIPVVKIDYSQEGPNGPNPQIEFTTTRSGLKYRILREGKGPKPTPQNTVSVSYRGWLDDGTEFDNSYKDEKPISLSLMQVVPGWREGLQLIGEGGKIEFEVPSHLGYGPGGRPGVIPPDATLHFIIELHDVL